MATILVCHGAWSGGWAWKKMREPLARRGHDLVTPTYTGVGERSHLAGPDIDLDTHIADIVAVIDYEDLHAVVLIGHSYGGMVATGVADRRTERIAQLIYLDAFVPEHGQSVFDMDPDGEARMRGLVATNGVGAYVSPLEPGPDISKEDRTWIGPRRTRHPLRTFEQKISLTGRGKTLPKSYIYCRKKEGSADPFLAIARRVRTESGWRYFEIDAGHAPNVSAPDTLANLIHQIVARV